MLLVMLAVLFTWISIHALREEGDRFLLTLSLIP